MPSSPRVAVGTVQPGVDLRPALWALLEALRQQGVQVQGFLSRACFTGYLEEAAVAGVNPRHLDSWLMPPQVCREAFVHGTANCDLAVVGGDFSPAEPRGGRLDRLCDWLGLSRVVVLDASQLGKCQLPARPQQADAVLLDRVSGGEQFARLTTNIEALWGVPVLGGLEELRQARAEVALLPAGTRPSRLLCYELGRSLYRWTDFRRLLEIAARREWGWPVYRRRSCCRQLSHVTVALAYDDAFNCYFPDVLDGLESAGAAIVDFSPLRDDRLPTDADIVYLGCGHPERHAAALSHNHCMKLALRNHIRAGGRLYAEGGGLAYLCQELDIPHEGRLRMAGIFPAVAHFNPAPPPPEPVTLLFDRPTWLGQPGSLVRGYRNQAWRLEPVGPLARCAIGPSGGQDVFGGRLVVGSRVHLNFAAQPDLLPRFFRPPLPVPEFSDPWAPVA